MHLLDLSSGRNCRVPRAARRPSLRVEAFEDRLTPYSVSGNAWPIPDRITVSFVPDGTLVNGVASNLQATFNTKFGAAATWQNVFKEAAQVWAQQTNINFVFVADSGAATGSGSYQQGDPAFGDIRIGGYNFGTTTLAQAFMPPPVNNYSVAGDIAFNTSQTFNIGSAYNLFTVASHEFGHALGLNHGAVSSIMASAYPGTVTALTADDISGIKAIYSAGAARANDSYDAAATNETSATASLVTSTINTTTKAGVINNLNLSTSTDADWYKFVVPAGSATTLKVKAVAANLSMLDPKIEIYDSAAALKATGNAAVYGGTAAAQFTVAAGQTWYVKVSSADAKASFKTGKYSLILNMGTGADPAVTATTTQSPKGATPTSGGGIAVTDGVETPVNTASTTYSAGMKSSMLVLAGTLTTTVATGQPAIAMDGAGNYVVVWQSVGQDGDQGGIYAKRYNALGVAQGGEFRVNVVTAGDQAAPAVAMRPNGDFVVTWQSHGQDGSGWGIYARQFSAAGVAQSGDILVNTITFGDQITPAIGIDGAGNFTVAWSQFATSWGVYAQRFTAAGAATGSPFVANTTTAGDQVSPVVGMDAAGNFTVGWSSYNPMTLSWGIFAQRYTAAGAKNGAEIGINQTTAGDQKLTHAAMTPDGKLMFVWTSQGQDGSGQGVYARRYDAAGAAAGNEFRVNTTTAGDQTNPSVAWDTYGNFYFTWSSYGQDAAATWGIYGQQFNAAGAAVESEFRVNSTAAGDQVNPTMAMDGQGHLVVVWNGNGVGDTDGVFMQRYSVNTALERPPVGDSWEVDGAGPAAAGPPGLLSAPPAAGGADRRRWAADAPPSARREASPAPAADPAAPADPDRRPEIADLPAADDAATLDLLSGGAFRWWRS